jgi:hypothetical protein
VFCFESSNRWWLSFAVGAASGSASRPSSILRDSIKGLDPRLSFAHSHTCTLLTFVHIHRRPLPPTLADLIELFITNRCRGGGQGVLLRRLGEKAPERVYCCPERVYCCPFSQQGQPAVLKLLQTPFLSYLITSAGCLWRAPAWRVPARGPHYSFNI